MAANLYLDSRERSLLEGAKVGIAGAGGLGSNCAAHLVRAGVRQLVLADFDRVEARNLNRQFFFRDQLGMGKVEALAENLRRIEPGVELELHPVRLEATNIPVVFSECDLVVEAFDSAGAKSLLLECLLPTGKMVVAASGIAGWGRSGEVRTRRVGRNLVLVGDGSSGVGEGLAPVSPRVGIAAAMQANAVVSLILGEPL